MTTMDTPVAPVHSTPEEGVVHLTFEADGLAVLRLGAPGERVVTFTERRLRSLEAALRKLHGRSGLAGVVVTGPGPGMFAAGADIKVIEAVHDAAAGEAAAREGRSIYGLCQELAVPVVGAIEGPCLGGGLELALAFDLRVVSDAPGTLLGLPEVKLGIVPGFGGTQRLTRLLGLPAALDLILTGRLLDPRQSRKVGIADRVVPSQRLLDAARAEVRRLQACGRKAPVRRLRGFAWFATRCAPVRNFVADRARKAALSGQGRFYPAPLRALELCLDALRLPPDAGFANEARALGELIVTPVSKALVRLFFLTERAKRLGKSEAARPVQRAHVVGGGVMGAGIAGLLANKGVAVRLCDLDQAALARAKARLQKDLDKRVQRRRLAAHEAQAVQDRLAVSGEWGSLQRCDLFLEAVVEDLAVKQRLFATAVERGLPDTAVLATNTSSLPIDAMAEGLRAPQRVVGIHFFNPPEKMPLVEVIRGARTSDPAVATACALAVRLGKFPIVVQDAPGFLVNRCLAPYLNEAALLLLEGNAPEAVDRAMLDFGMPMGPARLLDEIGFDVADKVSRTLSAAFGSRMTVNPLFAAMVQAGALGQKSGGGLYDRSGSKPGPGRAVLARLRRERADLAGPAAPQQIVERLIYPMLDEGWRCLAEGLVAGEEDLDLGLVMGIGFPPFTGGPTVYARRIGLAQVVATLERLAAAGRPGLVPSDALRAAARG
ncbi:MAG: enoyl-CoA hydratase/isomerase family protein [Planctomycetes bacterium]|nr:enoyl-CoA hydratase/isomerase family protein [Planctomycetota bacterium]